MIPDGVGDLRLLPWFEHLAPRSPSRFGSEGFRPAILVLRNPVVQRLPGDTKSSRYMTLLFAVYHRLNSTRAQL